MTTRFKSFGKDELPDAVLITGASSGIGKAAAFALSQRGLLVFAGVRSRADKKMLEDQSPNIRGLVLDVTIRGQIESAHLAIKNEKFRRFHLVNNAGILVPGPLETIPLKDLRRQFDVNVFGLVEISQIFLPLLRKAPGRLVHVGSMSGLASSPYVGAYAASKFALEAIADSMRWELSASGIKVTLIEPGPIATPIWKKGLEEKENLEISITGENKLYYESSLSRFQHLVEREEAGAIPAEKVAQAIVRALTQAHPPARIQVASVQARISNFFSAHTSQSLD